MTQNILGESAEFAESPRPLAPETQESVHPGLRPSVTKVPVTPEIHRGEYNSWPGTGGSSYFTHDINKLCKTMAQSPSEAASGAKTYHEVLRRMSLSKPGINRRESLSLSEIDPRAAYPGVSLSGGIISATFCIPHSLKFRKGADWVSISYCH